MGERKLFWGGELTSVSDSPSTFLAGGEDCGWVGVVDRFLIEGRGECER